MIKIYGRLPSRTFRCLWMLEELGLKYEWIIVQASEAKDEKFLGLNPLGKVPVLSDDGLVLRESLAINLYLANRYGGAIDGFYPEDPEGQGLLFQWTLAATTEFEKTIVDRLSRLTQGETQISKEVPPELVDGFSMLERELSARKFLLGEQFSSADLNVASVISSCLLLGMDLQQYKAVQRWLNTCLQRDYPARFFREYVAPAP